MIPKLRTEVWLRQDLCSLLNSIDKANSCLGDNLNSREVSLFRAGFRAAIEAMAVAIDVPLAPALRVEVVPRITSSNRI